MTKIVAKRSSLIVIWRLIRLTLPIHNRRRQKWATILGRVKMISKIEKSLVQILARIRGNQTV